MSGNKSEIHEEKARWTLTKSSSPKSPPAPNSSRRNTATPSRSASQRELNAELNPEKEEEKKGRLGGSLLAKFAKARLKARVRTDSSATAPPERERADTNPKEFGLRRSARQRKSVELREAEIDPPSDSSNRRASFQASRERKNSWRFSLPEQLQSRVGEDKRVFPAHSWSTTSTADPNELFVLGRKLGESPLAPVFKATVKETGFLVASKIFPMRGLGELVASLPQVASEISLLQRARHPNVVRYYGTFYNEDCMWIVSEYCTMNSIAYIQKYGIHFSELQLAAVITSVLHGLAYLHTMGIIHQDLKCANILMNELGDAKLADFGMPYHWMRALEKAKGMSSSSWFTAPEVLAGEACNQASDIWSFGITVIEMADGQPPYAQEDPPKAAYLLANRPPPTVQDPSKYSAAFLDFLHLCLQKDPKKRPSARELLRHDFVNSQDSRRSEEVIARLLQQYQRARSKKAALLAENRKQEVSMKQEPVEEEGGKASRPSGDGSAGRRLSRELLSNIVHYVKNELNLGNSAPKEKEKERDKEKEHSKREEEPTTDTLTEIDVETLTFTGTDRGLEDDESSLLTSDSSLSNSASPGSSPRATTSIPPGVPINPTIHHSPTSDQRPTAGETHLLHHSSSPATFNDTLRLPDTEEGVQISPLTTSARLRTSYTTIPSLQQQSRSLVSSKHLPIEEINAIASAAPASPLTPGSAKKEVSFATEKRESDAEKKKEGEKANNGAVALNVRGSNTAARQGTGRFSETREREPDPNEEERSAVEHYLNQSIINVVKELLSWKSRCQQLEIEMAQLILEKQKQSQLIQQSQQLLQYSLSSQLSTTQLSLHGSPLTQPASVNRQLYTYSSVPSSPVAVTSPPLGRASQPLLRVHNDKRRRSTSSMQNIW